MSLLSILVLLCCTVVSISSQTCSSDSCKKFQLNKEHLNKRFRGPGLYEVIAPGHHDCVRNCFYLSPCKSTDYNRKDKMCKLNDVDSSQIMASDFEQQNGAIFSDITAWPPAMAGKCGSRPCSQRQRCIPDKDSYHCEDISCGGVPSIQNDKVVLSKPGKYLYGHTATVQCDMGFSPNQSTVQCSILEKWGKAVCVKDIQLLTMSDQRTVAIAIKDSEHSMYAFNFYVHNVHKPGDRIVLVHVPEYSSVITDSSLFTDTQILSELLKVTEEKTQELIEKYALKMEELRLNGYVKQQNGTTPGDAILEAVKEEGAVLLILGSKGRGFIRRTFLGSVSDYCLHHCNVPVIVCRHKKSKRSRDQSKQ